MRRLLVLFVTFLCVPVLGQAQTPPIVSYDYVGASLATVQAWTPVLYVNSQPFVIANQTCTQAGTSVSCSFQLPTITPALTASGAQTFELALRDAVLGEGPKSSPLVRTKPGAPISLRFGS